MEALGRYILTVTAASILLAVLRAIIGKTGNSGKLIQLIGGLFLTFTIISPVADVDLDLIFELPRDLANNGRAIAEQGQVQSREALASIIKPEIESYILDKAKTFQANLEVEVTLSREEFPVPSAVRLQGSVSPYAKSALRNWLRDEMGIPEEDQLWIGS